ncbi:MAG: cytidylate kinase family protein, partial [Candidatus Hodarchaeota archaeon]
IMVGEKADLRILVMAPLEERVKRIAKRDCLSLEEAKEQTLKREFSENHRYKKIYGVEINDAENYDIALNTAKFTTEKMREIIKTIVQGLE